jgi:cyclopropane-fatty-acyl-phospholipid synthase
MRGLALRRQAAADLPHPSLSAVDRWLARKLFATTAPARIQVELWDGSQLTVPDPAGTLVLRDRGTLLGLLVRPELDFGERYVDGRLSIRGDLGTITEALSGASRPGPPTAGEWVALRSAPANTLWRSWRNVHHHYDLGNEFYRTWLDPELLYTCAYYPSPDATLDEAQIAKLELVCRKLRLQPGEEVFEAGCGWGALALYMARKYGVHVRAYNISREQLRVAHARAAAEGLNHRVAFFEEDYRNARGRCDVFVSLGMLEHVGRHDFRALAEVMRRCLDPTTGRGLLHFIGRDHPRPLNAWIRRRIFPGAYPPTISEVTRGVLEPAEMSMLDVENLRLHYARTLMHWRKNFRTAERAIARRWGVEFARAWDLYLAGSQAAFATGWLQLFQIVFAPTGGRVASWLRPDPALRDDGAR